MESFISDAHGILKSFGIFDFIDIVVVAFILYYVIRLVRDTRAMQLLKGVVILIVIYGIAAAMQLRSLSFLIRNVFSFGVTALIIVMQPELRHMLEQIGRTSFQSIGIFGENDDEENARMRQVIAAVGEASRYLSRRRIGALIVFERQTKLGEIIKTGTIIDAAPSSEMLGNIFFPNSPLHDGALIIRGGRLHAAGCYLPLSENYSISKEMGTRHRAGLGMSENSDAIVVIVSEETGIITIAENGKLRRGFTSEQLVEELTRGLIKEHEEKGEKRQSLRSRVKRTNE